MNSNSNDEHIKYYNEYTTQIETEITQNFCISRHLNSCNNMVDNARWTNATYKFGEPPLSMWGIISGLSLKREPYPSFENFNNNNVVYVSCLVRTWMTAIIEYLPYSNNNEITLIVSPFIKETDLSNKYYIGQSIDKGNMPIDIKTQIEKLKYFFSFLKLIKNYLDYFITENNLEENENNIFKQIHINTYKIFGINYFNKQKIIPNTIINIKFPIFENLQEQINYNTITLQYTESIDEFKELNNIENINPYSAKMNKEYNYELIGGYSRISDTNINNNRQYQYFKNILKSFLNQEKNNNNEQKDFEIFNEKNNLINDDILQEYKMLSIQQTKTKKTGIFNKKFPTINLYTQSFGKEGILLFINWIKNVINDNSEYIYVVAHSNIMQATLYDICNKYNKINNINKRNVNQCNPNLPTIVKQNVWEIIIEVDHNINTINSVKIRQGKNPPNSESKRFLIYNREKELSCGSNINNIKNYIKQSPQIHQQYQQTQQHQQTQKNSLWYKFKNMFIKNKGGGFNIKTYKKYKNININKKNKTHKKNKTYKKYKIYKKK